MKRIAESDIITFFDDYLKIIPPFACLWITNSTESNSFYLPALRKQASALHRLQLNAVFQGVFSASFASSELYCFLLILRLSFQFFQIPENPVDLAFGDQKDNIFILPLNVVPVAGLVSDEQNSGSAIG
jgi:hypothetical protein